jgi:hypothetical protein
LALLLFRQRAENAGKCAALMVNTAAGFFLQLVDLPGSVRFGEISIHVFAGFLCQCIQIGALGSGHLFIAGLPLLRILDAVIARRPFGCLAVFVVACHKNSFEKIIPTPYQNTNYFSKSRLILPRFFREKSLCRVRITTGKCPRGDDNFPPKTDTHERGQ